ncbi:hypothetical protein HER10_EVM0005756 [Colletotrichum scovillei]|uniref:Sulfite exporter family protein n=1 Tax=Colletotrichum scovillei TaxID=1209932 RepID=A0A9P7R7B3_9PEZI|nr:uncharacterized protein HER10_EVM0005756 [Colletotrichum scovillei]KAF4783060.1 hypothetical protein HER10_EVM0005756 [Colletotrichum scovillei]KAG7051478.1 sulfite exporter family protein [Colletotrichum scovillei]KAG7070515.1 sulfite exporter family protein [Colletotrichum scovillei]KAG7078764.1 sulfite exporter family protein [Colletotrichum scovillei]
MARWNRLISWGLLLIFLQVAVAQALVPVRRQESGTTTAAVASATLSRSAQDAESTTSPASSIRTTAVTTTESPSVSATVSSPPIIPTIGSTSGNSSADNSTMLAGELPIEPKVTPGWAVAGVILLCTGVIYSLIGIKNTVLHTAFSVAYVVALGITVLVVYVMVIPVSNGSQGAYVVAAVLPAVAVGVLASWFFKEITECLGCALGGFCFSMWLLCVHEGGLLTGTGKIIFIIVFSLAGFALYFSRWTRDWALMCTIAFSGATATVLGIDCFSRAGLKEFWAYIWGLNDNLFPQDTNTYPLTKGIRVEIAAIIVITIIGVISQKRLWNVIKDKRTKREEELAEAQRARDDEEANIGRELEARTALERRAWERAHGDYTPDSDDHDSGFARDSESEKGIRYSQSTATPQSHAPPVAEMQGSDVPPAVPPKPQSPGLMVSEKEKEVIVTVRVAPDETHTEPVAADRVADSAVVQSVQEVVSVPEVVPLPFRFPDEEALARDKEERSTIATFADDDEEIQAGVGSKRSSFAKRLSQSSVQLMRRVSQRTSMSHRKEDDGDEELAVLQRPRDDDAVSLAATVDTQSDSGAESVNGDDRRSIEINAQLSGEQQSSIKPETTTSASASRQSVTDGDSVRPVSAMTAVTDVPVQPLAKDAAPTAVEEKAPETAIGDVAQENSSVKLSESGESQQVPVPSQQAKSTASLHSTPLNLTQERLPPSFSNVALHYRTNEWAKHLSHADAPEPEILKVGDDRPQTREAPAPVHVEELKQTALSATPAPAPAPSRSPAPVATSPPALTRPKSTQSPNRGHSRNSSYQSHRRASSKTQFEPIAEEEHQALSRAASTRSGASGIAPSATAPAVFVPPPPPPGIMSYDSPQSLIAQRSVALRNKTYGILTGANNTPEISAASYRAPSETGSMYNYPVYPSQMPPVSLDDLPLSQRREIIRRQSSSGTMRSSLEGSRSASDSYVPSVSADNLAFDSHQPMRYSNVPSQDARDARLASFRDSVRADLRAGTASPAPAANGRDMALSMFRSPSASNLAASQAAAREAEVQRNIDLQRSFMMSQKEAEAKRKEKARIDKERSDQAFTRSMQSGEMFELHREAMRRMQNQARNASGDA